MGLFGSKTPTGKIDELVAEAKVIADELEGYNRPRARMLTAEAYLDEAIRNARTERENVETREPYFTYAVIAGGGAPNVPNFERLFSISNVHIAPHSDARDDAEPHLRAPSSK